jgi:transketolase
MKTLHGIRRSILEMVMRSGGHMPSAFSIVEILVAIYQTKKEDDVFLLSKGHGGVALYAVLNHFGLLTQEELDGYGTYSSKLGGHPHRYLPHVLSSSGSLGHGLPMAVGYALAKKILKEPGWVYCLIGDGESNEGTTWEAALHASHLKLDNLTCIVDNNNSQGRSVPAGALVEKFKSFGWAVSVVDGHDVEKIAQNLPVDGLRVILANTVKGRGIAEIENKPEWHHRKPTTEEYKRFIQEL